MGATAEGPLLALPASHVEEHADDFVGWLHRRFSRARAVSQLHTLSAWRREWCALSHNLLALFASKTNLVVHKCVLLSAVRTVEAGKDGRTFHVVLDSKEKLIFRVPGTGRSDAATAGARCLRWIQEVLHRVVLVRNSGRVVMPCMSLSEASELTDEADRGLHEAARRTAHEAKEQLREARSIALVLSVHAVVTARAQVNIRHAFDELSAHARLEAARGLQRTAAAQRLAGALGRPRGRLLHAALARLAAGWDGAEAEYQRACCRWVHPGAVVLAALVRDREQGSVRFALARLRRSAAAARRRASCDQMERSILLGDAGHPVAEVAQQLRIGGQILRIAVRNLEASQREWALRAWRGAAARAAQAESQELMESTAELNSELVLRCRKLRGEGLASSLVHTLCAAQQRRVLSAFTALKARGGRPHIPAPRTGSGAALPGRMIRPRLAAGPSPGPSRALASPNGKLRGGGGQDLYGWRVGVKLSPLPRTPLTESTDAPS